MEEKHSGGDFGTQAVWLSYAAGWMLKASEKDMRACDQFNELHLIKVN